MFISPTQAIKLYDVSKPTLYKDMSNGKLAHTKDDRNRRKLNVAELDRVYEKRKGASADLTSTNVSSQHGLTASNVNNQHLVKEIQSIREQIEQAKNREIELLEDQVKQFKNQVENLRQHLKETREEHRGYMRLLEDKRKEQGAKTMNWEQKLQAMEYQLTAVQEQNKLLIAREEERKKRIEERRHIRKAEKKIEKEKNKSIFHRLRSLAGQWA